MTRPTLHPQSPVSRGGSSASAVAGRRADASARRRGPWARGFTIIELLAVIMIIALLASLATPSFIAMIRDRRVVRAGLYLIDGYREARTRSLSRGVAVVLRWQGDASGRGKMTMREAIVAPGAGVTKGCVTSDWNDGSTDTRIVNEYDFASPTYELLNVAFFSDAGLGSQFGDVCFAPDGRTFARYAAGGVMTQLTGVLRFEVVNNRTTQKRIVFVPPNGVARYQL